MQAIKENPIVSTPKNQKKSDTFIDRILENIDQVNAQDWEMYSDLSAVYPSNVKIERNWRKRTGYFEPN